MIPELADYDWANVFATAGEQSEEGASCDGKGLALLVPGNLALAVTRDEVTSVIYMKEGESDGARWEGCFGLTLGRFMWISAGCDYTGWS